MQITIIGFGKMGKEVESMAVTRGHKVILKIDVNNINDFDSELFGRSDVAIEFTTPDAAHENIRKTIKRGIPVVSGTTGWTDRLHLINDLVESEGGSFLHASNFSIGVNVLFYLNNKLAVIMNGLNGYDVTIEESHHIMKKDAPSGTAITLADGIISECSRFVSWHLNEPSVRSKIGIKSRREGQITGTHRIDWNSDIDTISLEHKAHNRKGFALGAVFAAEFIHNKQGIFTMNDILGF